jgi:hypothetical protein
MGITIFLTVGSSSFLKISEEWFIRLTAQAVMSLILRILSTLITLTRIGIAKFVLSYTKKDMWKNSDLGNA